MKIASKKDKKFNSIVFSLVILKGSIHEHKRISGITHLIEHLCFKGWDNFSQKELYHFCEQRGVQINAITGKNFLEFNFICRPEVFDEIIILLSKMLSNGSYHKENIDNEINIILSEIEEHEETNGDKIINSLWEQKKFANSILGNETSLKGISLPDIIKYKKELFNSNGMVFLLGNFSESQYEKVKELFGYHTSEKAIDGILTKQKKKEDKKLVKFIIDEYNDCDIYYAFHVKLSKEEKNSEILCIQMLHSILCQGDAAYIKEIMREKLGYIYEIFSKVEIIENEAVLLFKLKINKKNLHLAILELEDALSKFIFDSNYFSYIKAFFCDNINILYDNIQEYLEQWVSNYIIFGENISPNEQVEKILTLPLTMYNDIYQKMVNNRRVYLFGNISSKERKELVNLLEMTANK